MIRVLEIDEKDLPRLLAVRNAVVTSDPASVTGYVDWRSQAEDMGWFIATDDGLDVGGGHALVGWHAKPGTATVEAWTLAGQRGRGVGQALYRELLEWAGERGCVAAETVVAEDDTDSRSWAERRGFREIGRNSFLVLDLTAAPAPTAPPPAGVEIHAWADRPGIERDLYAVYADAVPDIPGEEGVELPTFESWLSSDMQGSSDRPDAVFVALAGSEVVGYAKLSVPEEWTGAAWHDLAGVKRAWRGRGIAAALKARQIAWAQEQGYERLIAQNEVRNEPIRRLNERYGYRVEPGRIVMRTALAGPD